MSVFRLYEISRRAMSVQTARMQVAGQNVANAGTEGYSRQRVGLRADQITGGLSMHAPRRGSAGAGVSVQTYERMRDGLLDTAAWDAQADLGFADESLRGLTALEGVLGADGGGLTDALDQFWNAWGDVADNPTSEGARSTLLSRADHLAGTLNRYSDGVATLATDTQTGLGDHVEAANGLLSDIAALNSQIQRAQNAGTPDLAAEDQRDQAVKDLAALLPVDVQRGEEGYSLTLDGVQLVFGNHAEALTLEGPPAQAEVGLNLGQSDVRYTPNDGAGRIGAGLHLLTEALPAATDALDALAGRLVADVNALHTTGYAADGSTGHAFFDPATSDAASIRLSDALGVDTLAAYGAGGLGDTQPAQALAALRTGFADEAARLLSDVGARIQDADAQAQSSAAVADHLGALSQAVSGVSIDEEMTRLLEAQQAYAASARVLTTAEAMMDTLLSL